ncbi:MAG: hypothetical protein ACTSRP_03315 [Candidatus Helarchaeota archaeon]
MNQIQYTTLTLIGFFTSLFAIIPATYIDYNRKNETKRRQKNRHTCAKKKSSSRNMSP